MAAVRDETHTPARTSCPVCGAPGEPGQLVCLECGARMGLDYRRPRGWKLPVAIVAIVVALAGAGLALVLGKVEEDAESEVAKAPARGAGAGRAGETEQRRGERSRPRAEARRRTPARDREPQTRAPREPRPRPEPRAIGNWPDGRNGYTVVLASTEDRRSAVDLVRSVRQRGNSAGFLRSSDYSSLDPGFWLVFSGVYRTRPEADRAAERLSRAFPGLFTQFIDGAEPRPRR